MNAEDINVPPSIEVIWEQFHLPLRNFILKRVEDPAVADDVLQEVYLKIYQYLHSLRDQERLQSWLYQVARNAIADQFRGERDESELSEALPADDDEIADDLNERLRQMIRSMIRCLPEEYQNPLLLTEYEGMTQKEVAERLGLSFSGAKSRVQRGRDQLRELMLRCCHFQFDRLGQIMDYESRCCRTQSSCNSGCDSPSQPC